MMIFRSNQLILKVKKIESYGKLIEIQIKDGRKVLAQIFPCYDHGNEVDHFEISCIYEKSFYAFYYGSLEEALEIIRKKIDNYYNMNGGDLETCKSRSKDRIKKNFGAWPVDVSYEKEEA